MGVVGWALGHVAATSSKGSAPGLRWPAMRLPDRSCPTVLRSRPKCRAMAEIDQPRTRNALACTSSSPVSTEVGLSSGVWRWTTTSLGVGHPRWWVVSPPTGSGRDFDEQVRRDRREPGQPPASRPMRLVTCALLRTSRKGPLVFEDKRLLGAYYSPEPYARLLVWWALAGTPGTILDPSYGGCAMLRVALDELRKLDAEQPAELVFGADIDGGAAQWASHLVSQGVSPEHLRVADFLSLTPDIDLPRVNAVVGNPPYVRHHRLSAAARSQAASAAASAGVHLSGRASLWAYFVIHAAQFLQPRGRMALLVPGAILQADYAPEVLANLQRSFEDVLLVRVRERIFDDAQEETVALLAACASEGAPVRPCRFEDVDDLAGLERLLTRAAVVGPPVHRSLEGVADWKMHTLPPTALALVDRVLADGRVRPLSSLAKVSLGTVTGANEVFVLDEDEANLMDVL